MTELKLRSNRTENAMVVFRLSYISSLALGRQTKVSLVQYK